MSELDKIKCLEMTIKSLEFKIRRLELRNWALSESLNIMIERVKKDESSYEIWNQLCCESEKKKKEIEKLNKMWGVE